MLKRVVIALVVVAFLSIQSFAQCGPGGCPGGCPSKRGQQTPSWKPKAPAWRPKSNENEVQLPAVVHVNFQWENETIAMGTGFIADEDKDRNVAVVITCAHGYKPLMNMEVVTQDGRAFKSKLLGVDMVQDLLIIQIADPGITPLVISSSLPEVGDKVYMAGFPRGGEYYGSNGVVEGWYNPEGSNGDNYLATTCDAQPGCSGGPVLNTKGEVVLTVTGAFGGHKCVGPCLAKTLHLVTCSEMVYRISETLVSNSRRLYDEVVQVGVAVRTRYGVVRVWWRGVVRRAIVRPGLPGRAIGPRGLPGLPVRRAIGARPLPRRPPVAARRGSPRP